MGYSGPMSGGAMLRAVDNEEIRNGSDSLEDSLTAYLSYGVAGAATSAVVGIANSFKAIGSVVGLDVDYLDEREQINSVFGYAAADFYDRHKTGVDVTGMVAGTLVPGLLAVKALRAAQVAGRVTPGIELTSGLTNADLALGSAAVRSARSAVLNMETLTLRNPAVYKAYAAGFKQQALEGAVFEAAALIANNQNSILNPEKLELWDALGSQFKEGLPFLVGGVALGGAIEAFKIRGFLKGAYKSEEERTAYLRHPEFGDTAFNTAGDKLLYLGKTLDSFINDENFQVPAVDQFAVRAREQGIKQIKNLMSEAFQEANQAGEAGLRVFESLLDTSKGFDPNRASEVLSGLTGIKGFNIADYQTETAFATKSVAPWKVFDAANADDFRKQIRNELLSIPNSPYRGKVLDGMIEYISNYAKGKDGRQPAGFAAPNAQERPFMEGQIKPYKLASNFYKIPGHQNVHVHGLIATNQEVINRMYPGMRDTMKAIGLELSEKEFKDYVILHELGHSKFNRESVLELVQSGRESNNVLVQELELLSRRARPLAWAGLDSILAARAKELEVTTDRVRSRIRSRPDSDTDYLYKSAELTADAAAMLVHPKTREWASKVAPETAKLMEKYGALARPWQDTRLIYNSRTKEMLTSALPGASDVGKVVMKDGHKITIEGTDLQFGYAPSMFKPENLVNKEFKANYMHYSSMWAAAALEDVSKHYDKTINAHVVSVEDLPRLERLATTQEVERIALKSANGEVQLVGKEDAIELLTSTKTNLRNALSQEFRYNEQEIAQILNMSNERGLGMNTGETLMMAVKDYSKPEHFIMSYSKINPLEVNISSKSMYATQYRMDIMNDMRMKGAASVLEDLFEQLPEIDPRKVSTLSQADTRASLFTAVRTEFGSFRETASYVQTLVNNKIRAVADEVTKSFTAHYSVFNDPANFNLRTELSLLTNAFRREWYVMHTAEDGTRYAVKREWFKPLAKDPEVDLDVMAAQAVADRSGHAFKMSPQVADFFDMHKTRNATLVAKKGELATAKGRQSNLDDQVLYPPPRNLRNTPYFAFVIPKPITAGAEPQKYMIYAATAAELETKRAAIQSKYGSTHKVVTKTEVEAHKKLMGEYDRGQVFDEIEFDASLARTGHAQELMSGADINVSNTLELYRNWHIRQEEALIRQGIELRYADVFQQLKAADDVFSEAAKSRVGGKVEKDTIYKDTMMLMLDAKSYGGEAEQGWKRINDWVGEEGSRIVSGIFNSIVPGGRTAQFPSREFDKFNAQLAEAGFNAPFKDMAELLVASTDERVSQLLPSLVRTFNNLVSTTMLRLDVVNSYVQVLSTPILLSPVIREAKMRLQGTPQGKVLDDLTTVMNPVDGRKEPTSAKLMAKSMANFWSPEGKQFLEQLTERGLIPDHLRQYIDAVDFEPLAGNRHTLKNINAVIDKVGAWGSKYSGHTFSEAFGRFMVADCMRQVCELRGITGEEMFSVAAGAIDKVHGVYRGTSRTQIFNGTVGQAIGLYQTYMFNFMQNALKYVGDRDRVALAQMAGLQGTIYGLASYPGFTTFNQWIGESNRGNLDLFTATGADDPKSHASYALYGMGSAAFITPIDLFSRGDMAVRNAMIIPTTFGEIPAVSIISKAVSNMVNTVELAQQPGMPLGTAFLYGLAHNGMNRPLQGLANISLGQITSGRGTPYFTNSNYVDYDATNEISYGMMLTRVLGSKPRDEAIMMDDYFRKKAYQASARENAEQIGEAIKVSLMGGDDITGEHIDDFALKYERSGGDPENFNAFWSRLLSATDDGEIQRFRERIQTDTPASRAYHRMQEERSVVPTWEVDAQYTPPPEAPPVLASESSTLL